MKKFILCIISCLFLSVIHPDNMIINKTDGSSVTVPLNEIEKITFRNTPENMIFVEGGSFFMGADENESQWADDDEVPRHEVFVSSFYIGKYEVTQKEFQNIMGEYPSHDYGIGDDYPVYYVDLYHIVEYCNRLSIRHNLEPCYVVNGETNPDLWAPYVFEDLECNWQANGYRLPTEAEWEYAAGGGQNSGDYIYSGSDTPADAAWYGDHFGSAHIVGRKVPNELGIFDMSGNIAEKVWNFYAGGDYYEACSDLDNCINPIGPSSGSENVLRGGSWYDPAKDCRISARDTYINTGCYFEQGFRIVRSAGK